MLESSVTYSVLPASNLQRAVDWYRDKLELEPERTGEGSAVYGTGTDAKIQVYETENAGTAQNTAMGWMVDDIDAAVEHLRGRGVVFEDYDFPGLKTENGIATNAEERAAWFTDSEGNILCISQRS
ncbi:MULTISPECIES: VOC family protein [unclassified Leifsonia]|uniref:VOC family protein n=1 Tax=unclassified Leifsonia TaxID=2663824 RepID=UPI000A18FBD4|nr:MULTISPECIES: VOC family protein [unclassified Leifsonia]QIZ98029.1 VOC family protein [Leifsonia sp. PS1209]